MCYGCFKEYKIPDELHKKVHVAVPLVQKVYEFSSAGGGLHIVVDDYNLEDGHIDWCIDYIKNNENGVSPEQIEAELKCAFALKELTENEALVFQTLVRSALVAQFMEITRLRRVGAEDIADSLTADFSAFLFEHPGARQIWIEDRQATEKY